MSTSGASYSEVSMSVSEKQVTETDRCTRCGSQRSEDALRYIEGERFCNYCWQREIKRRGRSFNFDATAGGGWTDDAWSLILILAAFAVGMFVLWLLFL